MRISTTLVQLTLFFGVIACLRLMWEDLKKDFVEIKKDLAEIKNDLRK